MAAAVIDAWNRELGAQQGLIKPVHALPEVGENVFCLGFDQPLHAEDLLPGDFVQLEQLARFTPGTRLFKVNADVRAPKVVPTGYKWIFQLILDDIVRIEQRLRPGSPMRRRQFSINVSKLPAVQHYVTLRLRFVTDDTRQFITTASYDMGTTAEVEQFLHPSAVSSVEAFGMAHVGYSFHVFPGGVGSAYASGTAKINTKIAPTGIPTSYASGAHVIATNSLPIVAAGNIATLYVSGSHKVQIHIQPSGIATGYASGTQQLNKATAPTGIATSYATGTCSIRNWDPQLDLSTNHFYRGSQSTSPWNGTSSLGSSSSFNMSNFSGAISGGTALNGITPPDFDGGDSLTGSATISNVIGASSTASCWGWALFIADTAFTDPATDAGRVGVPCFFTEANEAFAVGFCTGGCTLSVFDSGGGYTSKVVACGTAAWHLMRWRIVDNGTLEISVDGGAFQTQTFSGKHISNVNRTGAVRMGSRGGGVSNFFDGRIIDVCTVSGTATSQTMTNVKGYINTRYNQSF